MCGEGRGGGGGEQLLGWGHEKGGGGGGVEEEGKEGLIHVVEEQAEKWAPMWEGVLLCHVPSCRWHVHCQHYVVLSRSSWDGLAW